MQLSCTFYQQNRIYGFQIHSRSITLNSLLTNMTKKKSAPHSVNRGQSRDMQAPISLKTLKCILSLTQTFREPHIWTMLGFFVCFAFWTMLFLQTVPTFCPLPSLNPVTESHFDFMSLVYVVVQSLSSVQLFCDHTDCSTAGSSVHGISQARIQGWVAISSSRGFS